MTGIGEEVEWIKARATRTRASTRRRVRGGGRSARFVRNARSGDGRSRARGRRGRGCVWPRSRRERKGADSSRGLPEETEIRAIRPKTCVARKSKTAHPVELTAEPRAHGEAKGREILLITWTTVTGDTPVSAVPTTRWRAPARARPRTRPRRAAPARARRLARDEPLDARPVPSRSRRDTRGGSRDRAPSVSSSRIRTRFHASRSHPPRWRMAGAIAPALAARLAPSRADQTRGSSRRVVRCVRVSPAPGGSFPSLLGLVPRRDAFPRDAS